ncbi:hypothetical protein PybrP1_000329 [[Pythium] brassicae (nom. inval.)]|nr:hypothetical protein PybrP1_000329 [[Pythium] brassicae (nom. inval.)]
MSDAVATDSAAAAGNAATTNDHLPVSPLPVPPLVSDDLQALLTRLQLRFVLRSPRSMWLGRPMLLQRELAWTDVLGAHILTADGEHVDAPLAASTGSAAATYLLGVFACQAKHQRKGKHALKKRRLLELFFQFRGEQMADVEQLRRWINYLADPRSASQRCKAQSVVALTPEERAPRRFLVLINPVGGAGKGVQTYENKVAPVFRYAGIDANVQVTTHAGHATDVIKALPLNFYDCVLSVGGDGSLSEIIQGLMSRPDWNRAIRQPIGIVPSGSGNGLAHSILHQSQEKAAVLNAAFVLAKGAPHDIDIASVRNSQNDTMYSFLSLEWAAIADVDMVSEKLRALGSLRFGVGFAHHIFFTKKDYAGTLWYLEDDDAATPPARYFETHDPDSAAYPALDLIACDPHDAQALGGTWREVTGNFHLLWVMSITHAAGDAFVAPHAQLDDGYNYITYMDANECARSALVPMLLAMEHGEHVARESVRHVRTRAYKLQPARPDDALCVDGELFPGPALESQVHRGLGRVLTLPRTLESDDSG